MKLRPKRSAPTDAVDLQKIFASLPKTIHGELICEITHHLNRQMTVDVLARAATFDYFIHDQQSLDPLLGERIRSIAECVLRDQIIRQLDILRNCARACSANNTSELMAVKASTDERLRQFRSAYAAFRTVAL